MKKIISREEFESLSETIDIDILLTDEKPDRVLRSLTAIGIADKDMEAIPCGVIHAKVDKNKIKDIENIDGVEEVEVTHK